MNQTIKLGDIGLSYGDRVTKNNLHKEVSISIRTLLLPQVRRTAMPIAIVALTFYKPEASKRFQGAATVYN